MFGDSCRFRYVDEKCVTQDCEIHKCEKRHPKICRYKNDFDTASSIHTVNLNMTNQKIYLNKI